MADVKISELTAQASANVDVSADVLALVDTSATQTKKISVENLLSPITIDKSAGTITSLGTVTGSFQANGGAVFNEGSADVDFRVESNDSANMLFVDGGNNKVLIEANNTDSVTDAATMIAASALEVNGNAGEGSDILRIGAMADASGGYFLEASNGAGNASYNLLLNPINGGRVGIGGVTSPEDKLHIAGTSATVSDTQLVLEGRYGGYGAGINFVSRTSNGGTNVSMAKITADGESAFDTTAGNQDAGLRFFTTLNGNSAEKMRINASGGVTVTASSGDDTGITFVSDRSGDGNLIHTTSYNADNSAAQETSYARIRSNIIDNSDGTEDGSLTFGTMKAGTMTDQLVIESDGPVKSVGGIYFTGSSLAGADTGISSSGHGGDLRIYTNGTNSTVFKSNGYVGIGSSDPNQLLTVNAADGVADNAYVAYIGNQEATDGRSYGLRIVAGSTVNDAPLFIQDHDGANDLLIVRGNGRMGIGITAPNAKLDIKETVSGQELIHLNHTVTGANQTFLAFKHDSTVRGTIIVNDSTDQVVYNTTSDERVKENIEKVDDALSIVNKIPVKKFNFIGNEQKTPVIGYIGQELIKEYPQAVSITKTDDFDDYHMVDESKMVAVLMKAVQELSAKVGELENA